MAWKTTIEPVAVAENRISSATWRASFVISDCVAEDSVAYWTCAAR